MTSARALIFLLAFLIFLLAFRSAFILRPQFRQRNLAWLFRFSLA